MILENVVNKLTECWTLLYYRQWEKWELLTIGAAGVFLLLLLGGARRKVKANVRQLRERSPIIGIRLAGRGVRR